MKNLKDANPAKAAGARPEGVPEKFWDAEKGALDVAGLLKSYAELERKLGEMSRRPRDKSVLELALETDGAKEGYDIALKHRMLKVDGEVNKRLAAAGFTNAQAQLVYDLAADVMMPLVEELVEEFRSYRELERLEEHFGGEERFDEISRQLMTWAGKNLSRDIFESLSSSCCGVIALYNMMATSEPGMLGSSGAAAEALSEKKLKDMMRDPRYWRDGDKDFIRRVDNGFKTLYGDE
jgi:hypothetical protein